MNSIDDDGALNIAAAIAIKCITGGVKLYRKSIVKLSQEGRLVLAKNKVVTVRYPVE